MRSDLLKWIIPWGVSLIHHIGPGAFSQRYRCGENEGLAHRVSIRAS